MTGLVAGAAIGLFAGERTAVLQPLADGYIKLLQMTVLPYVTLSIVAGLGALSAAEARVLGKRLGLVIGLLWGLAIAAVWLFPIMFPPRESASFFSTALTEDREPFNFLDLYIPSNPFNSLANNVVPAVVLFSIVCGAALMSVPGKARLLELLRVALAAVSKVTDTIVAMSPYGMCAIGAIVAGTLSLEELEYLQVYVVSYVVMALLISLWVLPGLVATLTPVPYRALMSSSRDALVIAFMTTSLFAVLPLLTAQAKTLVRTYAGNGGDPESAPDVIVPTSFNFPHTGKILSLSFVLFAGWFMDAHVAVSEYPRLAATGLLAMFGSVNAAIPFLLDLLRLPADTFRLFVTSGVVNARFGTLVAAVHTLAVAVLGTCALAGALTVDRRKLARYAVVTALLTAAAVGGTRLVLEAVLSRPYELAHVLTGRRLTREGTQSRVFRHGEDVPPLAADARTVLERVRDRGVLRVGFFDDSLPYAFFNQHDDLVGFDVEMARELARDLRVDLELVPASRSIFETGLDAKVCDIVMSGVVLTVDRAVQLQFSSPYLDETIAFVVPDHLTVKFSEWSSVRELGRLRIGVPRAPYYVQRLRDELNDVEVVFIDRIEDMFVPHVPAIDAFVMTAERGSAYTLLHPAYSVAVPKPRPFRVPLAYVIAGRDAAMTSMVNTWIEQKRRDGTVDELFSYWILGQDNAPPRRRWSIMDNVLGWRW
jgi:Na+/H+-dicarboxylate symporter/ABC-type amino acid transport substrate-binding protein